MLDKMQLRFWYREKRDNIVVPTDMCFMLMVSLFSSKWTEQLHPAGRGPIQLQPLQNEGNDRWFRIVVINLVKEECQIVPG